MLDFLKNMRDANTPEKIEGALLTLDGDAEAANKSEVRAREALEAAIDAGDAKALGDAERALDEARRQRERLAIARASLERRLVEAHVKAEDDRLAAVVRAATAQRDAVRRRMTKDLAPALKIASEVLAEILEADRAVSDANDALKSACRHDMVAKAEDGFTPRIGENYPLDFPLVGNVSIRPVGVWGITGFNWRSPPINFVAAHAIPPGADRGAVPPARIARPVTVAGFVSTD